MTGPGELRAFRCQQAAPDGARGNEDGPLAFSAASRRRGGPMPQRILDHLHENYAARMRQLAYRITRNEADAEDAVQDALLRAYEKYDSFRHESSLWTWVYRITQTSALMILKKNRALRRVADASSGAAECHARMRRRDTPEHFLVQARLLDALGESVEAMPPSLRLPMRDYLRGGLSQKDLCNRHGLTLLAAKARLHRARVLIRGRLGPHLQPEPEAIRPGRSGRRVLQRR